MLPPSTAQSLASIPGHNQRSGYSRWEAQEEEEFYAVLESNIGRKPDEICIEVSLKLTTKSHKQVGVAKHCCRLLVHVSEGRFAICRYETSITEH